MFRQIVACALLAGIGVAAQAEVESPKLDQVQAQQRERIQQGIQSGELNAPETKRLLQQQRHLRRHEVRVEADGALDKGERARLYRDAANNSRHIHRQKHDAQQRRPSSGG
jgi:hypothetical protein